MNKALMISIQPQHAVNILIGKKTLELRTWIPKGYVGWVYVYCTKSEVLEKSFLGYRVLPINAYYSHGIGISISGSVVARFWFDDYIAYKYYEDDNTYFAKRYKDFGYNADEVLKRLCLSRDEFKTYGKGKTLYAWHINKLEIFDKPKQLSEFKTVDISQWQDETGTPAFDDYFEVKKAPQKFCYCYVEDKE